jgi:hypothetical protein
LDRFDKTQSDFRQAVVAYQNPTANGAEDINAAARATILQNARYTQNNISLKIYTISGKEVDLSTTSAATAMPRKPGCPSCKRKLPRWAQASRNPEMARRSAHAIAEALTGSAATGVSKGGAGSGSR